jgi:hypothetical protein
MQRELLPIFTTVVPVAQVLTGRAVARLDGKAGRQSRQAERHHRKAPERAEKVKIFVTVNDLFTTFKEIVGSMATQYIYLKTYRIR